MSKPKGMYTHPDKKQAKKLREVSRSKRPQNWYEDNSDKMRDFLRGKR